MQPNNSVSWYLPQRNENICSHRDLYMNVYSSIRHSCQNWKHIYMFSNWRIDKQNVENYSAIKKEQTTGKCNNMYATQKPYDK